MYLKILSKIKNTLPALSFLLQTPNVCEDYFINLVYTDSSFEGIRPHDHLFLKFSSNFGNICGRSG